MKTLSNAFLGAMFVMLTSFATVASAAGTVSTTVNADTMFTSVEQVEAVANKVNEAQGATDAESLEATEDFINLLRATGLPATGSYSPSHINADSEIDLVAKMFLVMLYYGNAYTDGNITEHDMQSAVMAMLISVKNAMGTNISEWPLAITWDV